MSLSDDEEALFDDIYGDEDVKEEKKEDFKEEVKELKNEVEEEEEEIKESITIEENNEKVKEETNEKFKEEEEEDNAAVVVSTPQPTSDEASSVSATSMRKADLSRDAGKMFIGGLDWDTTEDTLKEYFSQYGEVIDHTIMRENSTGRSRGFGFLTFADSKSVDAVVRTQHVLDGKVIDPKRAIPREEQDKTGKIFVGGIAPEVRPHEFEEFFSSFGSIIDAQLMLDKDTGRSRGFGFVTFDSPDAVNKVCQGKYLDFNGRQIEVKRAEPRGPQQQQNHIASQQQRYMQQQGNFNNYNNSAVPQAAAAAASYGGVTSEAMADYFQKMQQYWAQVQQAGIVDPTQIAQYTQQVQQVQQQPSSVPPPPSNPPPLNAPTGPRGGGGGSGGGGRNGRSRVRSRSRAGYTRNQYHPYQR